MDENELLKQENEALKKKIAALQVSADLSKITDQKNVDYQESQIRFKTVFECSKLGNKIISSDLHIHQVNPAMVQLLGYANKEEIIGRKILEYTPEENQQDWKALQESLWEKLTPSFSLETCLRRKDGSIINCQVTSILFQDGGETLGYTIIEDITEQRRLRRQKEDFISVASHELKTPITSLKASLQLLSRMVEKETGVSDKIQQLVKSAEINTIKLGNLVVNLLDATKLEQGQLSLNVTKFKISDIIDRCCAHIRMNDQYEISLTGDVSLEVLADEEKIEQVIVNLINNAVKYAPNSREILIHIEKLDDGAKICVIDKGPGVSETNISKLFGRYFRVNNNGNHDSGLGLGLYISSEIIRRHKGTIGLESKVGEGSNFWFTLPFS